MSAQIPEDVDRTTELLERYRRGDNEALGSLLVRNLEWIRAHVHRQLGGVARRDAETEDVVQDVVVRVLQCGPRFVVSSKRQFRALMACIVTNTLRSQAAHAGREKRTPERERGRTSESVLYLDGDRPQRSVTPPDEDAIRQEQRDWIKLGMLLLDGPDQDLLHYRGWDNLRFKEIGELLGGITEDTARMRHNRALRVLEGYVVRLKAGRLDAILREQNVARDT